MSERGFPLHIILVILLPCASGVFRWLCIYHTNVLISVLKGRSTVICPRQGGPTEHERVRFNGSGCTEKHRVPIFYSWGKHSGWILSVNGLRNARKGQKSGLFPVTASQKNNHLGHYKHSSFN